MLQVFLAELHLAYRRRGEFVNPLIFFVMVCALFPLAITPEHEELRQIAPGVIWVAAMLATLLSLDVMFKHDFDDGSLEQMLFSGHSLYWLVMIRVWVYWLLTGLPLILISPVLATMFFLPIDAYTELLLSLLLGTPTLAFIGSIAAALTVSVKKGGLILSLLTLPLFMPVLIFATSAVTAASQGLPSQGQLMLLVALLILGVLFTPIATAVAIKISVSND